MDFLNQVLPQFFKHAEVEYHPHQKAVAEALKDRRGILVYHGLGSGKTLTSILAAEQEGGATVVVPASLRENFQKELKKAKAKQQYDVMSYEKFTKKPPDLTDKMLILDEAHRIRTSGSGRSQAVRNAGEGAKKVLLLTGTPVQNKPHELAPLVNLITNTNTLPLSESDFNRQYLQKKLEYSWNKPIKETQTPYRLDEFRSKIKGLVSYYKPGNEADYPVVEEKHVHIPMSERQIKVYREVEKNLPRKLREKIQNFIPPDKQEAGALNAFLSAVRQVSNTSTKFDVEFSKNDNPKLTKIVRELRRSPGQSVVYSNYLDSGVYALSEMLRDHDIDHELFTGKLNDKQKKRLVDNYNSGKTKVLLISSAGGEGLDLKNTRQVHIMEPHWHEAKVDQVVGRAIRYKSHEDLPEKDRNVTIFKYYSTFPEEKSLWGFSRKPRISVDEYLKEMSAQKRRVNDKFLSILREESIT